jgi:hypothetical protein
MNKLESIPCGEATGFNILAPLGLSLVFSISFLDSIACRSISNFLCASFRETLLFSPDAQRKK